MPTTAGAIGTWLGSSGVAAAAATAAVGALATSALTKKPEQQAQTVAPLTAADKPQQVQAPDVSQIKNKNAMAAAAAGALGGNNSTLLSGSQGVAGTSLNLGSTTLLGQ